MKKGSEDGRECGAVWVWLEVVLLNARSLKLAWLAPPSVLRSRRASERDTPRLVAELP
jgi:hypothetical protein